jgi:hypothetical protein
VGRSVEVAPKRLTSAFCRPHAAAALQMPERLR